MKATEHEIILGQANGDNFNSSDLRITTLQNTGHLRFTWTPNLIDHLRIVERGGNYVLEIFWFKSANGGIYPWDTRYTRHDIFTKAKEMRDTWKILFGYDRRKRADKQAFLAAYNKIPSPEWYCCRFSGISRVGRQDSPCLDVRAHFSASKNTPPNKVPYSKYPLFEKRLRALQHHMDIQQPKGLRGLWRDKRNSYSFYTLWLVVIFGGLSVLLAFASLAISAAQAWAAFHPPVAG